MRRVTQDVFYICYVNVCSDISLSECYLGTMERWRREAYKTEMKNMFQLSNEKLPYLNILRTHAQKEDITLFDSKSTSIHSLVIQHVYTLKKIALHLWSKRHQGVVCSL